MNRYFYSPTTKGFYNEAMHGQREIAGELTEQARKFGLILGPEVAGRALQFHETLNGLKAAAVRIGGGARSL